MLQPENCEFLISYGGRALIQAGHHQHILCFILRGGDVLWCCSSRQPPRRFLDLLPVSSVRHCACLRHWFHRTQHGGVTPFA